MDVDAQKRMAVRFGADFAPIESKQIAGVAIDTLSKLPLNAARHPVISGTSGWFIWGGETLSSDPEFFQPLHHSHLAELCANLEPYLGLAPGWRVLLAPNQEDVWFDAQLLAV